MFDFHVSIVTDAGDLSNEDTQWKALDGQRESLADARAAVDNFLSRELADGWSLGALSVVPAED